jgi:hypothetical protein
MRIRAVLPALVTSFAALALSVATVSPSAAAPTGIERATTSSTATALFRLSDPRLTEVSGLAIGHRSPSVLYVQNDGGGGARFYALDAGSGVLRAVCTVPGAQNVDWEDIATAPDRAGRWSIWLADIGDNDSVRPEVRIYRVTEPVIGSNDTLDTERPDVWRLRYPDGPHDAESLVVDPVDSRLYVITKALLGHSEVFEAPPAPDPDRALPMSRVGSINFSLTGTPGGPNPIGQLTATGAAMAADGSLLAVRTYTDAYLWQVGAGRVAAALRRPPMRIPLPAQPQGEGIAVSAGALLLDSEGTGTPVYQMPLPTTLLGRPGGSGTSSGGAPSPDASSPDASASGAASTGVAATGAAAGSTGPPSRPADHRATSTNRNWLASTAIIAALAAVALLARRRRRH